MLRDVTRREPQQNTEDAFRTDFAFDLDWGPVTTIDFGYRYNETRSKNNDSSSNVGLRTFDESPTGNLFASILKKAPIILATVMVGICM